MSQRTLTETLEIPVDEGHDLIVAGGGASGLIAAIAAAGANSTLAIPHAPVRAALRDQGAAVSVADCEDR